jgi:hypothetical protein
MAKRVTQNEKSFDNNVVKKNQRTTLARENRKLRPDLMMNNLVIYTTTIWWSTLHLSGLPASLGKQKAHLTIR